MHVGALKGAAVQPPGKGGTSMFGAAVGLWRDAGPVGFFRGWLPAYMRDARRKRGALWLVRPR